MKPIIVLMTVMLAFLALSACSGEETDATSLVFQGESERWSASVYDEVMERNGKNYFQIEFTYKGEMDELHAIEKLTFAQGTASGSQARTVENIKDKQTKTFAVDYELLNKDSGYSNLDEIANDRILIQIVWSTKDATYKDTIAVGSVAQTERLEQPQQREAHSAEPHSTKPNPGESHSIEPPLLEPPPDTIELAFVPLQLDELQTVDTEPIGRLVKAIPFGEIGSEPAILFLYEQSPDEGGGRGQLNGLLKTSDNQYGIGDLSYSFIDSEELDCAQICVHQRVFPAGNPYELIGSIALFANGPGRQLFVVYDTRNERLSTFEGWGKAVFIDLDEDGNDEFVIEFEGLHLNPPDLSVVRPSGDGLEISLSVFDRLRRNQGDFAILAKNETPARIVISNMSSPEGLLYHYVYRLGTLEYERSE